MKKIAFILLLFVSKCFAWETFAEYEMFCYLNNIEPSFEDFKNIPKDCCFIDNEELLLELLAEN